MYLKISKDGQILVVSSIIFVATLSSVILNLIPVLFPALLSRVLGGFEDFVGINPFEVGAWAYLLIITNCIVFGLLFLHFKKMLPQTINKSIKFIFNFEVSPTVAFFVVTVLVGIYITFSVHELFNGKDQDDFFGIFKPKIDNFSLVEFNTLIGYYLMLFLENASLQLFANYKVIPFIASISLLVLTYFFTAEITKKRFAGIVAMVILLQSEIFLIYDTTAAYPNFWILFYLLSLYLILKKWPLSPISFIASALSKAMTAAFLPFSMFFIFRSSISKRNKKLLAISYGVVVALGAAFILIFGKRLVGGEIEFNSHDFLSGFSSFAFSFRGDGLFILFLLPITVGLFMASKKGVEHADSMMLLIMAMLLSAPFLGGFSDLQNMPYRFVPLIVFFAIGVGILLSKRLSSSPNNFPRSY